MNKIKITVSILLLNFVFAGHAFSQKSPKEEISQIREEAEKTHKNIDWNAFDPTSKIAIDSIRPELIQGSWKAYNGLFLFNGSMNSMTLTTPIIIEIKEGQYKRSVNDKFEPFAITNSQIKRGKEIGFINKITDNLLVITWNNGPNNYVRYYYEK